MRTSWLPVLVLLGAAGPAWADQTVLVLIADGAGDYRGLSTAVRKAVDGSGLPLEIQPACWSLGYGRSIADQCDRGHIRAEGRRLAEKILAHRAACPGRPVCLMAHSAGNLVALAAAEWLPADCVERVVLLAPTVPAHADLRPALRCARQGVDVYSSCRDKIGLLVGFTLLGRHGRLWCRVAARTGFELPAVIAACDAPLYRKLRHHRWDASLERLGHDGGHYGIYQRDFLHAHVLPLLRVS